MPAPHQYSLLQAGSVLRIRPPREPASSVAPEFAEVTTIPLPTDSTEGVSGWKWHGGVVATSNGAVYGVPSHARSVLKVQPVRQSAETGFMGSKETVGTTRTRVVTSDADTCVEVRVRPQRSSR